MEDFNNQKTIVLFDLLSRCVLSMELCSTLTLQKIDNSKIQIRHGLDEKDKKASLNFTNHFFSKNINLLVMGLVQKLASKNNSSGRYSASN